MLAGPGMKGSAERREAREIREDSERKGEKRRRRARRKRKEGQERKEIKKETFLNVLPLTKVVHSGADVLQRLLERLHAPARQ